MGSTEYFELCETSSEVQCPVPCDSSLPSGRLSEENLEFCNQRNRDRFPCTYLADFLRDACDVCPREVRDRFPFTARFVRFDGRRYSRFAIGKIHIRREYGFSR